MNFSFFHTALHLSHSVIFCEILQLFREIATPDRFSYKHRWARGGGAPQGKKLFEVDTQGEKGRHLWGEHFFSFLFSKITPWWKGRRENILAAEGGRLIF